jgi:hypothetical protein
MAESAVRILKDEHAVVLGRCKAGVEEAFSPRKAEASRRNSTMLADADHAAALYVCTDEEDRCVGRKAARPSLRWPELRQELPQDT